MQRFKWFSGVLMLFVLAGPLSGSEPGGEVYGQVQVLSKDNQPIGDNSGVVVYIREVNHNKGFALPPADSTMASENMEFIPEILPIMAGTTVAFPNNDDSKHNAFSLSKAKPFDLEAYGRGPGKKVVFKTPGQVNVNCNMHPRMAAYIMVMGNPYFTMTDEKGNFSIKGVPAGTYTVVCWFPYGFIQQKVVDLKKSPKSKIAFELVKMREEIPHKNKHGKKY